MTTTTTATATASGAAPTTAPQSVQPTTAPQSGQPDLAYGDTEEALRAAVRRLFEDRLDPAALSASYDEPAIDTAAFWRSLAGEIGVAGLLVPERLGGAGATEREAAVVFEEIGRAVAPTPFLTSAVLATEALLHAGDVDTVSALAGGEQTGALLIPFSTTPGAVAASVDAVDGVLHGRVETVAGAAQADLLVIPVNGPDGLELHVVAADATGVVVEPVVSLDMTRPLADVELVGVRANRVDTADAATALTAAVTTAVALLASEQYGVAQWCLDTTLAYVKERRQFGRVIGSYQAIKHRLADLWLEVSSARAAARYAADTAAHGDLDATIAAHMAASYCGDVAVRAAEECVQLHGGIGMTWEYPAHLYLKRAKADQLAFGTGYWHRRRLAELIDLAA